MLLCGVKLITYIVVELVSVQRLSPTHESTVVSLYNSITYLTTSLFLYNKLGSKLLMRQILFQLSYW